ncbi:MAG TPA: adenylate cyclase regulatory domain-containing protein [Solirubrobacteraceae bacterium]|nr:adenylate cyclase regulatory domain-containing protein [Solirubrobacteraceae bacterium]
MDFAGEGLLDGLQGDARASREQLLRRLADDGFTLTQLRDAVAEDRLILLGLDRVLGGRYTAEEVQARSGLPAATIVLVRRMLGLPTPEPGDRVFSDEDIEAAQSAQRFLDAGFSQESLAEITRVLGEGMARLAATITAAFADTYLAAGDSEEAVATRFETMARELTPVFIPVLVSGFTAQLRDSVGRAMLGQAELEAGDVNGAQDIAVAFADLVGFTRLAGQVELRQLSGVAGRLAELAAEVAQPPVRLVKTIGDAAMFVSRDPAALIAAALALVEAVQAAELPSLRAGIALGPAVIRAGDFFGPSVNLASRVTGVARPGSVLCTAEVREAAAEAFSWSAAGRHRLKGVSGAVALHRARVLAQDSEPSAGHPAEPEPDRPRKRSADRSRKRASS